MNDRISEIATDILTLYRSIATDSRTRRVKLLGRKCSPAILKTFLGFELQMGRTRLNCPDLTTARYLEFFAEIGCADILIPYDPTITAEVVPRLEKMFAELKKECADAGQLRRAYQALRKKLQNQGFLEPT
jgi:hypothetical protein